MTETKKLPYSYMTRMYKQTDGQTFGRPTLKKAGQEKDIYKMIQAAREDTEIYATLEKYGCLDRMEVNDADVFADLTEITKGGLRGLIEREQEAENLWQSLPIEYRQEFQNNKALFMENGEKWLKERLAKKEKQTETEQEPAGQQQEIENA